MAAAIGQILTFALGVAISPVPIIALILMLFSNKAKANSLSFLAGWIIGLTAAGLLVLALGLEASDGTPSTTSGWIKIALGALFLFLAAKQWQSRPKHGQQAETPKWMEDVVEYNSGKAFGLGFILSALNPKNLGLTIAATASIGASGLDTTEELIVLAVFVLIASLTIIAPVAIYLIMGSKATAPLNEAKTWLIDNNNTVMFVLFLVIGAKLFGDGISIVW